MAKNGLAIFPIGIEEKSTLSSWDEVDQWSKSNPKEVKRKQSIFTEAKTTYLLTHVSGEFIEICGLGHGVDSQDKSAGKATTYALKYALLYTEYPRMGKRRNCIEARFLSCSGVTKRVIRLPRSRRYQFVFSSNTTKGSVSVEIYGTQNALMATLNNEQPCLIISTEEKTGYRVVTKFKNADGEYRLIWKEYRPPKESA